MPHCVYKISSPKGDKVYYGSTTKRYPIQRFYQHICEYNKGILKCASKILFTEYGTEHCEFSIIEEVNDLSQLRLRERYYIENNSCVNLLNPVLTEEEKKIYKQKYTNERKQDKKEYDAQYRGLDIERKIKIECYCGGSYVKRHRLVHEQTAKHRRADDV
jgi:hypothetical protein